MVQTELPPVSHCDIRVSSGSRGHRRKYPGRSHCSSKRLWDPPASSGSEGGTGNVEQDPEEIPACCQQRDPQGEHLQGVSPDTKLKWGIDKFAGVLRQGSVGWLAPNHCP